MSAPWIIPRFTVPSLSVALLVIAVASPTAAQTGPCPPTCAGTGHEVYSEVQFVGVPGHDIYNLGPNFFLDQSHADAQGSARGIVDLSAGTLKAVASSNGSSGAGIITLGTDRFTLGGLAFGTPVNLTAHLVADGTGLIQEDGASMQAMIQLGLFGGANTFQLLTFQSNNNAPLNQLFNIALSSNFNFTALSGTPFLFTYFLRLQSGNGAGSQLDFLNTARLTFDTPSGATLSSEGGFAAAAVTVPEPATLLLTATGIAAMAALRRRRTG